MGHSGIGVYLENGSHDTACIESAVRDHACADHRTHATLLSPWCGVGEVSWSFLELPGLGKGQMRLEYPDAQGM